MKHHKRARAHIGGFVERVNDPTLNWAWEVSVGVLDVMTTASQTETLEEAAQETWRLFFEALRDGESMSVLFGTADQLFNDCPVDRQTEFSQVITEAYTIGTEGGRKRKAPATRPETTKPASLRLVVNNTTRK